MFRSICSAVQSFFSSSSTSTGALPPVYSLAQLAVFPEENLTILEEVKDHPINFSCYGNLVVKVQEELFFKVQLSNEETKFLTKKKIVCTKDQAFNLHRNLSFQVQLSKVKPCHFQVVEKFQLFFAPENDHINSSSSHSDPISKNKKNKTNNNNYKKKMNQKQKRKKTKERETAARGRSDFESSEVVMSRIFGLMFKKLKLERVIEE